MGKKWANDLLAKEMPGMEIVERASPVRSDAVESSRSGASIEELRRKYLGTDAAAELSRGSAGSIDAAGTDEIEVVQVRPKNRSADLNDPSVPKTVILSKSKGIIGQQG